MKKSSSVHSIKNDKKYKNIIKSKKLNINKVCLIGQNFKFY